MRISAILSEAWRNVASGTTRAGIFATVLTVLGLGLALADTSTLLGLEQQAVAYQNAGAATYILSADAGISGQACDQLTTIRGITASGALRTAQNRLNLAAMPGTSIPLLEVTPHFSALLTIDATDDPHPSNTGGLLLSQDVGDTTGGAKGSTLRTSSGSNAKVAGVYAYPKDGRLQALSYAALAPVTADGTFDQCWAQVWPPNAAAENLISTALLPTSSTTDIAIGQLNTKLGNSFDGPQLFTSRLTAWTPHVAAIAGCALGYIAIRLRRLEIASARHSGVTLTDLFAQLVFETGFWVTATALVCIPAIWLITRQAETADTTQIVLIAARPALVASIAAVIGAAAATAAIKDRHLLRYFKER